MSNNRYDLSTLQEIEEKIQVKADNLGLSVPETLFHLVQPEEMYDIAARGLPGRYSHYSFGRHYQEEKANYDKGHGRIYELVINTRPIYAYLLDGNSLVAQTLVMAHVLGHATVFEHNRYFSVADKNILSRTRAAAERIDGYIGDFGRQRVEDFIDICQTLENQRSFDQLGKKWTAKMPEWKTKEFDLLFPDETEERRDEWKRAKEEFRARFPKQPERDFLGFFEEHARQLDDWQRDIISIIRMEGEYFTPQMRTNVVNEAQAVYYHNTIVQELMVEDDRWDSDDFMEFQSMNSRVLHPHIAAAGIFGTPVMFPDEPVFVHCTGINPYLLGSVLYAEVKRICETPTDDERERWFWAGNISWDEKRAELVEAYDDAALLSEFLSTDICEKAKLFLRPRTMEEYKNLRILPDELEKLRTVVVEQKTTFGVPTVEIVDADYARRGELLLEHRYTDRGLDDEYTRGVLPDVAELWGHGVVVNTVDRTETEFEADPNMTFEETLQAMMDYEPEYTLKPVKYRVDGPGAETVKTNGHANAIRHT